MNSIHTRFYALLIFLLIFQIIEAQDNAWLYVRATDTLVSPSFKKQGDLLVYNGSDKKLKEVLANFQIFDFKKTYRKAQPNYLKKTFFVRANTESLLSELLNNAPHLFESGEIIPDEDKKIFEPNDYGLTSTIGENKGLQINLDYLDFLGLPQAWYYTTGSKDIIIGISDGQLDPNDREFSGKTETFRSSPLAKGHGISQGANAVAQGDNGYGMTGLCYNCSAFGTNYGLFRTLEQLKEISDSGAKVINCSWVGQQYYEKAQKTIDEMFENGTIVVASAGNKDWLKTEGKQLYYPASYDKVISVSSVMYKYETPQDNLLVSGKGNPFAENIRGYISRAIGFKGNDANNDPFNYPAGIATLNREVDILAPTVGLFSYGKYILNDELWYSPSETTSGASPQVSGTIGLMFSLYPCLPVDEVESILKITSMNIDDIGDNRKYKGYYGSGVLQTGKAVKMVYDLYSENSIAYIRDQQFDRWNFKITSHSKEIRIENQTFTDEASLLLTAKNRIVLKPGTKLRPSGSGSIDLRIRPDIEKKCELVLRDPSIEN